MDQKLYFTKVEEMSLSDATKPLLIVSRLVGMNPKSNWHKIYTASILAYEFFLLIYVWEFHCKRIIPSLYFNVLVYALKDLCRTSSSLVIFFFSFVDRNRFVVPVKKFANVDRSLKSLGGILDNRAVYRGSTGIGFTVSSYRGKMHLGVIADKAIIQNEKLLGRILENTVKKINNLHEMIFISHFFKFSNSLRAASTDTEWASCGKKLQS